MTVAMDAMAVAIHIKYLVGQNEQLTFYLQLYSHVKLYSKQPEKLAAL